MRFLLVLLDYFYYYCYYSFDTSHLYEKQEFEKKFS